MFFFLSLLTFWYNHSIAHMRLFIGTVSQVSDVAHGPPVRCGERERERERERESLHDAITILRNEHCDVNTLSLT